VQSISRIPVRTQYLFMDDSQIISEIKDLIEQIAYAETQLDQRLQWLEKQIRLCLGSIQSRGSVTEAEDIFDSLSIYQGVLSTIVFKHKYPISDELRSFVSRFDRIDDNDVRSEVMKSAKAGDFTNETK
jgi:hypothetical protein